MSAAVLREAARLMRERAEASTPGPWEASVWESGHSRYELNASVITKEHGDRICDMDGFGRSGNEFVAKDDGRRDAYYIASWHPAVALAVADWLDEAYAAWRWLEDSLSAGSVRAMSGETNEPSPHALAVARAYLGDQP